MIKIKFKESAQFSKLLLVKHICNICGLSLKDGKEMVDSGVIECPNCDYDNVIKRIAECGGIITTNNETMPKSNVRPKPSILVKPNKNGTGLVIESCAPISEHTFRDLEKNQMAWLQIVTSIPFVVGLTQLCEKETNNFRSLLAVEVPESHNTINEIVSLSKIVDDIHAGIIGAAYKFQSLTEKFNPFIDDVEVETRLDNSN